jgi:hypothetical protein
LYCIVTGGLQSSQLQALASDKAPCDSELLYFILFIFIFVVESTQLARQLHQERIQMEVQ